MTQAFEVVKDQSREKSIEESIQEIEQDKITKECPNPECKQRYAKNLRKCVHCGVFFEKFLREQTTDDTMENRNDWSPDRYYNHVGSMHPPDRHETVLLDPLLGNPNSRRNILALSHQVKECAKIGIVSEEKPSVKDNVNRESSRQWTILSGDAAIALQV